MNTKLIKNNNGIIEAIHHWRITLSDMEIGLTGKTSLAQGSSFADHFCSIIDSSGAAGGLETCRDTNTVMLWSNNSTMNSEEFHHYMKPDDGMNAQHTIDPVAPLNRERH